MNDAIFYYRIKVDFKKNEVTQTSEQYKIIGVNNINLVIDNLHFTSIKHKGQYRGDKTDFNNISVLDLTDYSSITDEIIAYLYTATTNEKIAFRRIKKALEKHIYQKHGRYCNAITLLDQIKT